MDERIELLTTKHAKGTKFGNRIFSCLTFVIFVPFVVQSDS